MNTVTGSSKSLAIADVAMAAVKNIPPLWPLDSSVAVNPFLGQTHLDLATTAARLGRVGGISVTMPRRFYHDRILSGVISDSDLEAALAAGPRETRPDDGAALRAAAGRNAADAESLPTVADLAATAAGTDWPGFLLERFGVWAAAYLDKGQALWAAPRGTGAYAAWRAFASRDLTPEIMGVKGFAAHVADAPERAEEAIERVVERLGLKPEALDTYFHQLLMTLGGWAQSARYILWQAELQDSSDQTARDFLAIRLVWEEALFVQYQEDIESQWESVRTTHRAQPRPNTGTVTDAILQEAFERSAQRRLAATLERPAERASEGRPALQTAFCIDVRSEVFRRALETVSPAIRTLGFAGFFGIPAAHRRFASDIVELRLPVLLNPGVSSCATGPEELEEDRETRFKSRAIRAWNRFKLAAVSSFAFVEATGPIYMVKLLRDSLSFSSRPKPGDPAPRFDPALDTETRVDTAEKILRAMSLTSGFARLVLFAGHGARIVNNAHSSALQCGACGGYSGEVNARLLAQLLNEQSVRQGLANRGILIPEDTVFLGALHDTTTDAVTIFDTAQSLKTHAWDLEEVRMNLSRAGAMARAERALRLPGATSERQLLRRGKNWAEVRPEWGLAGCKAFIAAPRSRTVGRNLEGRAFLHDYSWKQDEGFGVLELIMTAPVVVASWISLQYYGSTVAPQAFGGGNKLLHNVVGGMGVVEGNGGALRPGLPWQSIHDGEALVHEPLRLSVCIEAPREAIAAVLERHKGVRELFDNRWLHLFALDEEGRMAWRYAGNLEWQPARRSESAG